MYITVGHKITKDGLARLVIWRDDTYAIAEVHACGRVINHEVWIIQKHGAYEIGGKRIEAGEHAPSTSQWGRLGFTVPTEADAMAKVKALREGVGK